MEEQKQAEQQWNKIRRERINILKEAPSEENLWQAVMAFQDYPFKTVTGLPFQYTLKTGKNGEWTKELWIDRREKSKSLSWSIVICSVVPNMMLFIFFGRTQEFQYLYSKGKGFIQSKILCKKESI